MRDIRKLSKMAEMAISEDKELDLDEINDLSLMIKEDRFDGIVTDFLFGYAVGFDQTIEDIDGHEVGVYADKNRNCFFIHSDDAGADTKYLIEPEEMRKFYEYISYCRNYDLKPFEEMKE